jgi:hypothetical protein
MSDLPPEQSSGATPDPSIVRVLRPEAGRVAVLMLGLFLLELIARTAFDAGLPYGRDWLWDSLARWGHLGALAGTAWLLSATLVLGCKRSTRAAAATALLARLRDHLCSSWPAARMAALFALATGGFVPATSHRYQLAWRAAAVFACGVLGCGVVVELALAWRRSRSRGWAPATWLGRGLWMALATFLGVLVFPRITGFDLAVVGSALLLLVVTPSFRLSRVVLAVLVLTSTAGIGVDARLTAVRRFASVHAPYSTLGLRWLRRLTDFDGDGSSGLLGLDCDGWDPIRQPKAEDLPANGIDEDCSGKDAHLAPAPTPSVLASASASHPDVLLVTVDALRADALAWMPRIHRWASHCISFEQARSASNFTSLAVPALITGTEPRYLRSNHRIAIVPPQDPSDPRGQSEPPTLAALLRHAGYFGTAVVPFQPPLLYLFHGFDDVRVPPNRRMTTPASEVLTQVRGALARRPTDRPIFLWAHFLDTHAPYAGGTGLDDYRRAATQLDESLGAFLESLPRTALVVLTADHGEAFGEHGNYTHDTTLFEEELRVPLVLCAPPASGLGGARTVSAMVSTLDVMPTVVELSGAATIQPFGGTSLVPYLRDGKAAPHDFLRFEAWLPDHHVQAVISGCHKWMRDLDAEWEAMFDVCHDPAERTDVSAANPGLIRSMRRVLFDSADVYPAWLLQARELQRQSPN